MKPYILCRNNEIPLGEIMRLSLESYILKLMKMIQEEFKNTLGKMPHNEIV